MMIGFTFFYEPAYKFILLFIIIIGSIMIFLKYLYKMYILFIICNKINLNRFYYSSPYYNKDFAKLWKILSILNLWTAIMLLISNVYNIYS
jgi:hypothetical protein